jgi:hypothetical protein
LESLEQEVRPNQNIYLKPELIEKFNPWNVSNGKNIKSIKIPITSCFVKDSVRKFPRFVGSNSFFNIAC